MRRAEIARRFDEIVEFSGVEPLPRHAGEALLERHAGPARVRRRRASRAGDPARRRGARGRGCRVPGEVPRQDARRHAGGSDGRLRQPQPRRRAGLCTRALLLEQGQLVFDGRAEDAVERYLQRAGGARDSAVVEGDALAARLVKSRVYGDSPLFRCTRIAVLDEGGTPSVSFRSDEEATVAIDFRVLRPVPSLRLLVTLTDANQASSFERRTSTTRISTAPPRFEPGDYRRRSRCRAACSATRDSISTSASSPR